MVALENVENVSLKSESKMTDGRSAMRAFFVGGSIVKFSANLVRSLLRLVKESLGGQTVTLGKGRSVR